LGLVVVGGWLLSIPVSALLLILCVFVGFMMIFVIDFFVVGVFFCVWCFVCVGFAVFFALMEKCRFFTTILLWIGKIYICVCTV